MLLKSITFNQPIVWLLAILVFSQTNPLESKNSSNKLEWQLVNKTFTNAIAKQNKFNSKKYYVSKY